MTQILLVTGSRRLRDTPAAAAWAEALVAAAIEALALGSVVVFGDARGPDRWAQYHATRRGMRWTRYDLDGLFTRRDGTRGTWANFGTQGSLSHHRWPLARNTAMVEHVAEAVAQRGYTASALALVAPWAKTSGTLHTAGECARVGIVADVHKCPTEFAPIAALETA